MERKTSPNSGQNKNRQNTFGSVAPVVFKGWYPFFRCILNENCGDLRREGILETRFETLNSGSVFGIGVFSSMRWF